VTLRSPLFALLAALALGACASGDEADVVRAGELELRATLEPETPRVGDNQLELELRDATGAPVEGAALEVTVEMPAMGAMPKMGGAAHVAELGDGRYQAHFALEMGGTWQVAVDARPPAGPAARLEGSLSVGTPGLRLAAPGAAAAHAHEDEAATGEIQLAPERMQRVGVRTAVAERRTFEPELRAAGRLTWDETRLHDVSLKFGGWIGDLFVASVGAKVERGQPLFSLYSPDLYAAQREYLLAREAQARARASGAPDRADYLVRAAENRLRLWDLSAADRERIVRAGAPLEQVAIRAPASGVVIEKDVVTGGAIEPGQRLYRIAPLDPIWAEAEVYENDLSLVAPGMTARLEVATLPGREWSGPVTWISPAVSEGTRTARVRVELANPDGALKPDMFATLRLRGAPSERLVVPLSAVVHAGERSFVFLDLGEGRLRPAPVEVGLRVGEEIEVRSGLEPGQRVVASATFLVAAESRLRAALDRW
jgi:Cu(I)/Ag(I) efflux system membrane fusion protein